MPYKTSSDTDLKIRVHYIHVAPKAWEVSKDEDNNELILYAFFIESDYL